MRPSLLAAVLLLAPPALAAPNDPWLIDPARSSIAFNATQVGKFVAGRIAAWTGRIDFDPGDLAAARIDIRMDMKSATTNSRDVDDMMRGKDFLDVERMPEARFVSATVTSKGGELYEARGKLTIRDVTRDVVLPFTLAIQQDVAHAKGRVTIKRLDYGVGRNEWAGTNYVADEVTIDIAVVANRPK